MKKQIFKLKGSRFQQPHSPKSNYKQSRKIIFHYKGIFEPFLSLGNIQYI